MHRSGLCLLRQGRNDDGTPLLVQEDRGDESCRDSDQQKVSIGLHLVIATGRSAEAIATPIIDNVLAASILGRQSIAAIEVMMIPTLAPIRVTWMLAALLVFVATTVLTACALRRSLRLLGTGAPLVPGLLSSPLLLASGLVCANVLVLLGKRQEKMEP